MQVFDRERLFRVVHDNGIHAIALRLDIGVQYPAHRATLDSHRQRIQCIMLATPGTEPVRESEEIDLVDCAQYLHHGLLHNLVLHRCDTEWPQRAIGLGDLHAPRGLRPVGA